MSTEVTRFFVQTTTRLHRLYNAWVGVMATTEVCLRRPSRKTKDTLGNALFLWARQQPPEKLAEMLEPYMDEFDKVWAARQGEGPPGESWIPGSVRDQASLLTPKQRREAERAVAHEEEDDPSPGRRRKGAG